MPVAHNIYASDNLIVRYIPAAPEEGPMVVTFDSYADQRSMTRPGFGEHFFTTRNISAIYVIARENDWYQFPDLPDALLKIRACTVGRRTFTYGSSMGAYAAIRFGRLCGAHAAIACSPQYSIDPAVCSFETRWNAEIPRLDFHIERSQTEPFVDTSFIFYDPWDADQAHANLYAGQTQRIDFPLPGSGHPAISFLYDTGLLGALIFDIIHEQFDADKFRRDARNQRSVSPTYFRTLCERSRTLPRKIKFAQRALALVPHDPVSMCHLGTVLSMNGQFEEALLQHQAALALAPDNWIFQHQLGDHFERSGDLDQAITAAAAVVKLQIGKSEFQVRLDALVARRQKMKQMQQVQPSSPSDQWQTEQTPAAPAKTSLKTGVKSLLSRFFRVQNS